MPPHLDMDTIWLDQERKKDLLMEKRLRACRVKINPRNEGYFSEPSIPPPVNKQPPPLTPSPSAVKKATNPVALRYWNQCMDKTAEKEINEITLPKHINSPSMDRSNKTKEAEVVKVLSTAGKGIERENEVNEALGNINRFFTIDKLKKDDAIRVAKPRNTQENIEVTIDKVASKSYNLVKEEQIKISKERTNFQNMSANRIPKSPKPFRRGVSETRLSNTEEFSTSFHRKDTEETGMNQNINKMLPKMDQNQKTQLALVLFDQLPSDIVDAIVVQQLSTMSGTRLGLVMNSLPNQTVSMAVPILFPRTKDDVKLSLILDSVPKLTKQLRQ